MGAFEGFKDFKVSKVFKDSKALNSMGSKVFYIFAI